MHQGRHRPCGHKLFDPRRQPIAPGFALLDGMDIVLQDDLLCRMREAHRGQPTPVRARPVLGAMHVPMAQQETAQLLASPPQAPYRGGPRPHQIAHRLVSGIGNPHRRQLPGPVQLGQVQRIPPVGLHPFAQTPRDQRRRHHHALMTQAPQVAINLVAARTGLIAKAQPPTRARKLLRHLPQAIGGVRDGAKRPRGSAQPAVCHRYRDRLLVNVQADICDSLSHDPSPMHEARHRTIRRNPRHLHSARRVTRVLIGHGV